MKSSKSHIIKRVLYGHPLSKRFHSADKRQSKTAGLPPGSLVYVGKEEVEKTKLSVTTFNETLCEERELTSASELSVVKTQNQYAWIALTGLQQVQIVDEVGKIFNIHPLVLEDILNTHQRPKVEEFDEYLFAVVKLIEFNTTTNEIGVEQYSIVLGANYLLTFQEKPVPSFDRVRDRLKTGRGKIRKLGADFIAYCLIDSIVDNYFVVLEKISERIELLEEEVVLNPNREIIQVIHRLKTDMIYLRRAIWPLREVINRLLITDSDFVKDEISPYLRDVYDHAVHIIDTLETFRDIVSGMLEIYLSSINHRLNEVMKLLTIISTIFMPLTFFTSWYGMNFKHMPELDSFWGYPLVAGLSLSVACAMLIFFRKKEWL